MKYLALLLLFSCSHKVYTPVKEVEKLPNDPVIVLDNGQVAPVKNYFNVWEGLTTSKDAVEKLIPVANCILNHTGFLSEMRSKQFTSTTKSGEEVYNDIVNGVPATVSVYTNSRFSPFTTLAKTVEGVIYLNTRYKYDPTVLVHEYMHTLKYGHASSKDYSSVPYQANIIAEKYVEECSK